MVQTAGQLGLTSVQLHGDEPAEMLAQMPSSLLIIKAYRCDARGLLPLAGYLDACRAAGRAPDAVLIDAQAEATEEYGGTGRVADWERIARDRELVGDLPLILAGGLTPANVSEAIAAVRPHGVDVASGVETQPGRKNASLVREFVAASREAFARL
jgi:phosphoribosylanthranilate isomerase